MIHTYDIRESHFKKFLWINRGKPFFVPLFLRAEFNNDGEAILRILDRRNKIVMEIRGSNHWIGWREFHIISHGLPMGEYKLAFVPKVNKEYIIKRGFLKYGKK